MIQKEVISSRTAVIPQKIERQVEGQVVTSFNNRSGAVIPRSGDYTAAMVGADPAGTASRIEKNLLEKIPTKVSQLENDGVFATEAYVQEEIAKSPGGTTGPQGPEGPEGPPGLDGVTFIPTVSEDGELSWDNNGNLPNPSPVNLRGPAGEKGSPGVTFTPSVSEGGILEWENDGGLKNPAPVDIKGPQGPEGAPGEVGPQGDVGPKGDSGVTFKPDVSTTGILSWTNDGGLENPVPVDIRGPQGERGVGGEPGPAGENGKNGVTFIPSVSEDGELTWINNGGMENPEPVNIKGPQGEPGSGGGTTIEAGPDMVLSDGKMNPKIPVRYLTQQEYDALTDEEKMQDVQYMVGDSTDNPGVSAVTVTIKNENLGDGFYKRECSDGHCQFRYEGNSSFDVGTMTTVDFGGFKVLPLETGDKEIPNNSMPMYNQQITYEIHGYDETSTAVSIGYTFPIAMDIHFDGTFLGEWGIAIASIPETVKTIEVVFFVTVECMPAV